MVGISWFKPTPRHRADRDRRRSRSRPDVDRLEARHLLTAGSAPTNLDQYMLELINRTRANPTAEGQRLINLAQTDPLIHQATANWNLSAFYQLISSYAPEPPLAFNPRLIDAANAETGAMLNLNAQKHAPTNYLTNSSVATDTDGQAYLPVGTGSWATGENIFAYSQAVNAASPTAYADFFEAGFLLDWGNPDFGHLKNILAPGPSAANLSAGVYPFSEIGIGLATNLTPTTPAASGTNVGPAIVTQEFGWRQGVSFLTGTFYRDTNQNGFYDPGEGYGGVTIRAQGTAGQGTFQTQTWSSGGYSLQLPAGTYAVTASGPLPGMQATTVTIGVNNVGWSMGFNAGQAADIPVPGNYNGGGRAELATYRPSTGVWTVNDPATGIHTVQFGLPGDIPVPGHYDGKATEFAVFRPSSATWYILGPKGLYTRQFGGAGDTPVPGDYDGDGKTDVAVYRPATGTWYVWQSGTGTLQSTQWGLPGVDQPVPAAYDGGGRTEIAVLRPTTYQWFIRTPTGYRVTQFGAAGMVPVPADYDGVGHAEIAVYQTATGGWFIQPTARTVVYGLPNSDTPAPADYDGDGRVDMSVYRNPTAEWFAHEASGANVYNQVGQGGTGPTLRTLGAVSLSVPGVWATWIASPGAVRSHSAGTRPAAPTSASPLVTPKANMPTAGLAQRSRRQHLAADSDRTASTSPRRSGHFARNRSSKKA